MGLSCEDIVKAEVMDYRTKVYFFSVFDKVLQDKDVKVRVEGHCKQKNGHECYPDFHCRKEKQSVIFEHKGSVSQEEKFFVKEIRDTERYLDLQKRYSSDEVVLIVPLSDKGRIKKMCSNQHTDIVVWGFKLDMDKRKLQFEEIHNNLQASNYSWLTKDAIPFQLSWCSLRTFLRDDPPVVYTSSFILNSVLRSFIDPWNPPGTSFDVDFDQVIQMAEKFFPPGPESNQITTTRVKKSLDLLNSIGWITYPNANGNITVTKTKRIRESMISDVLCEEFCKQKEGEQAKLEEFF